MPIMPDGQQGNNSGKAVHYRNGCYGYSIRKKQDEKQCETYGPRLLRRDRKSCFAKFREYQPILKHKYGSKPEV